MKKNRNSKHPADEILFFRGPELALPLFFYRCCGGKWRNFFLLLLFFFYLFTFTYFSLADLGLSAN